MSGAVATPAARPAPVFVTRRASGASRQLVRNARVVTPQRSINRFLPAPHTLVRCEAPLTGAASPRAPALRSRPFLSRRSLSRGNFMIDKALTAIFGSKHDHDVTLMPPGVTHS